jgi:hypothetical protein
MLKLIPHPPQHYLHEILQTYWHFRAGIYLAAFTPQRLDLSPHRLILQELPLQELARESSFFCNAARGEQLNIAKLINRLAEVVHIDPALIIQGVKSIFQTTR